MSQTDKSRKDLAERIKRLRAKRGLNQADFAALIEVDQSLISAWERGTAMPSGRNYFRLGSMAQDYEEMKWFWHRAGLDLNALDRFMDSRMRERGVLASASEFVDVPSFDPAEAGSVSFPSRFLDNRSSTRFLRLRTSRRSFNIGDNKYGPSQQPFPAGDLILIDPAQTDLRVIELGALIAVRIKSPDGANYHDYVGALIKRDYGDHVQYWLDSLASAGDFRFIGISKQLQDRGPVKLVGLDSTVLGRVVAWIGRAKEESK
jgi:DNA-binding XRE family transcriptional regulator